jgi:hypothetical protein
VYAKSADADEGTPGGDTLIASLAAQSQRNEGLAKVLASSEVRVWGHYSAKPMTWALRDARPAMAFRSRACSSFEVGFLNAFK